MDSYIHLADMKVSIVMAATATLVAGLLSCIDEFIVRLRTIDAHFGCFPFLVVLTVLFICALLFVFWFGIETIWCHKPQIDSRNIWFFKGPFGKDEFEEHLSGISTMNDKDIIAIMATELFKLNDINQQKSRSVKRTPVAFGAAFTMLLVISAILVGVSCNA